MYINHKQKHSAVTKCASREQGCNISRVKLYPLHQTAVNERYRRINERVNLMGLYKPFENRIERYISSGVKDEIPASLVSFMWSKIDAMKQNRDYLQVFSFVSEDGKQLIIHTQEGCEEFDAADYKAEYRLFGYPEPINDKIYVIDDGEHSTMILAEEY